MQCSKCGATVPDYAKFCGSCGSPVVSNTEVEQPILESMQQNTRELTDVKKITKLTGYDYLIITAFLTAGIMWLSLLYSQDFAIPMKYVIGMVVAPIYVMYLYFAYNIVTLMEIVMICSAVHVISLFCALISMFKDKETKFKICKYIVLMWGWICFSIVAVAIVIFMFVLKDNQKSAAEYRSRERAADILSRAMKKQ